MNLTIYWRTKDKKLISQIRETFGLPLGMTVNGETYCSIKEDNLELLKKFEQKGIIQIRNK